MFICRHCPYVVHVEQEIAKRWDGTTGTKGSASSASAATIRCSIRMNAPPRLKEMAERLGFTFPFCLTRPRMWRRHIGSLHPRLLSLRPVMEAGCTGQLDDSRPGGNKQVTGRDLRAAIDAVLAGKPVDSNQKASIGCSIKWKR